LEAAASISALHEKVMFTSDGIKCANCWTIALGAGLSQDIRGLDAGFVDPDAHHGGEAAGHSRIALSRANLQGTGVAAHPGLTIGRICMRNTAPRFIKSVAAAIIVAVGVTIIVFALVNGATTHLQSRTAAASQFDGANSKLL
jgi:hypothetical protein